jgi:predicted nucleic acid-binding protein
VTFVFDASVAVKWFVEEALHEEAVFMLDNVPIVRAPDFIVVEVGNVAWKKHTRGELTIDQARDIVFDVRAYIPVLYASIDLVERALDISLTLNHPVYDCLYLACAETTDSILITADDRLLRVVQQTTLNERVRHLAEAVTLIDEAGY